MAKTFVDDNGNTRTYYNPSEKGAYHAAKLKAGINPQTGKPLTEFERGQSSGYLKARRDSADAYLAKTDPQKLKRSKDERKAKRDAALAAKAAKEAAKSKGKKK